MSAANPANLKSKGSDLHAACLRDGKQANSGKERIESYSEFHHPRHFTRIEYGEHTTKTSLIANVFRAVVVVEVRLQQFPCKSAPVESKMGTLSGVTGTAAVRAVSRY